MNHKKYIGKKLRELVNDEYFCGGYYIVEGCRNSHAFSDEKCLDMIIESISDLCGDCTYWIKLKK